MTVSTKKAVSTWSLHRTLTGGLALLDLPAELARHGFDTVQICHFHLAARDPSYVEELRASLREAGVALDCLLIDDGEAAQDTWISDWMAVAEQLGAARARVIAGRSEPTPETIRASAEGLLRLAARHPSVRVVTENWHELLPNAASVTDLFARTGDEVGFLIDLGNWTGAGKYAELAAVADRAETCHAKAHHDGNGLDADDYRRSLQVLRDAGFDGPLALVYDGKDTDEWRWLDAEHAIVGEVFPRADRSPA